MPQEQVKPPDLDDSGNPISAKPPDLEESGEPQSLLSRIWNAVNEPLVSMSPEMKRATDEFTATHPTIGGVLSTGLDSLLGMTSPSGIALGAATLGEGSAIPAIAKASRLTQIGSGLAFGAKGGADMLNATTPGQRIGGAIETGLGLLGARSGFKGLKAPAAEGPVFGKNALSDLEELKKMSPDEFKQLGTFADPANIQAGNVRLVLDQGTGAYIPYDLKTGKRLGPAIMPGMEFNPELKASLQPKSKLKEFADFTKQVRASVDMSAPLRQGLGLAHRGEWWSALPDMVKAFGSENAYNAINNSIYESPLFKEGLTATGKSIPSFAKKSGLFLADHLGGQREEQFMSELAGKIPGLKGSERAYVTFLNKLRADTFESMIKDAQRAGLDPMKDTKLSPSIADFINTSTGRGSLGKFEKASEVLGETFFSPRLMASRVQMMNPMYYINQPSFVRKEALKSIISTVTAGTLLGQMARMGGATVSDDPKSADFGKIKVGNARLDPFGGFQQYAVLLSRMWSGKYTSSTTKQEHELGGSFGAPTRGDIARNFIGNKLAPVPKLAYDWLWQTKRTPFSVSKEAGNLFVPMFIQDVYDLYNEDPSLIPMAIPGALGMGSQVYK